jgi:hypothetical protein
LFSLSVIAPYRSTCMGVGGDIETPGAKIKRRLSAR